MRSTRIMTTSKGPGEARANGRTEDTLRPRHAEKEHTKMSECNTSGARRGWRMSMWLGLVMVVVSMGLVGESLGLAASGKSAAAGLEQSVVTVEVTGTAYDQFQPWSRSVKSLQKTAVALRPGELLTTADGLPDHTQIRLQKGGRGKWYLGKLKWIDYHSNLALVDAQDADFWQGMKYGTLAAKTTVTSPLQILRWRAGNLESRRADFTQFTVHDSNLSWVHHLHVEMDTELEGPGLSELLVSGGKVIGLVSGREGKKTLAIPSSFIVPILDAWRKQSFKGLGYFDFVWQPGHNPSSLQYLGLTGEPRGVLVIDVPSVPGRTAALRPKDVLMTVDGFEIDTEGDYIDPDYGHLMLENLATRGHWAGDVIKLRVFREGKLIEVAYEIPKVEYSLELVPEGGFDKPPEYLVVGGLVFQPLTMALLKGFGENWERRAPFRLVYYRNEKAVAERPSRVVLSQVLPDAFNLGYQESRYVVVDKVNGKRVSKIADLEAAFEQPKDGFHVLEFAKGDSLQRIVLDASQTGAATQRVLRRYGIPAAKLGR